jgi:hypothetical protein
MAGQGDAKLFEVEFARADGRRLRGQLLELFVEAFENALPVRPFRVRRHPPNYFARRDIGRGVVLDVRARERVEEMDSEVFAVTERACTMVGWDFAAVLTRCWSPNRGRSRSVT